MLNNASTSKIVDIFLFVFVLILSLLLNTVNIVGLDLEYIPGDLGDSRLNLYFFEHAHLYFIGELDTFWDAPFMFPEKNVIAYSDNLLGSAPIYSIFRTIGFSTYNSYQLWIIVISILNYFSAFIFLKYLLKNNYAALLGAFVFAFSISLQTQIGHIQMLPRYPIPIAFFMAVKFSEQLKPKYFFFLLVSLVYQIYCGVYLGFMLLVPITLYLLLIFLNAFINNFSIIKSKKWWARIIISSLINAFLLLLLMLPYYHRKIDTSKEHYHQIYNSIPRITSYFYSKQGSLLWDFLSTTGQDFNDKRSHQLFVGGIATICFLICLILLFRYFLKKKVSFSTFPTTLQLIFVGVLTFIFFLQFNGASLYLLVYYLPGFNSMRDVGRIINIELIFFAITTGIVFHRLFEKFTKHTFLIFFIGLILLQIDNYFYENSVKKVEVDAALNREKNIDLAFRSIPEKSLVSFEPSLMKSVHLYYHLDAMLLSQKYNLTTINAYTARYPNDYSMYAEELNAISRNYWLMEKNIEFDTLYVVKSNNMIEKVCIEEEIDCFDINEYKKIRHDMLVSLIKNNKLWMIEIEKKARQRGLSIDSIISNEVTQIIELEK